MYIRVIVCVTLFAFFPTLGCAGDVDLTKGSESFSKALSSSNEFVGKQTKTYRSDYRESELDRIINRFRANAYNLSKVNEALPEGIPTWARVPSLELLICQPQEDLATIAAWQGTLQRFDSGIASVSGESKSKGLSLIISAFTSAYVIGPIKSPDVESAESVPQKIKNRCSKDINATRDFLSNKGEGRLEFGLADLGTAAGILKDIWNGIVGLGETVAKEVDDSKRKAALRAFLKNEKTQTGFNQAATKVQDFLNSYSSMMRGPALQEAILSHRAIENSISRIYSDVRSKSTTDADRKIMPEIADSLISKMIPPLKSTFLKSADRYDVYFDAGTPEALIALKSSFASLTKKAESDQFSIQDVIDTAERLRMLYENVQEQIDGIEKSVGRLKEGSSKG